MDLEVEGPGETQTRDRRGQSGQDQPGLPWGDADAPGHVGLLEQLAAVVCGIHSEAAGGEEQSRSPSCLMHGTFQAPGC